MTFPLDQYMKELEILVNIDSGFGAPEGATEVGLRLAQPLVDRGWILERHGGSDVYGECIVVKNRESDHYDVMLVGHTDTVFPKGETAKRPFTRDEKRAYGVGTLDMKQGCLAAVYALLALPVEVNESINILAIFNPDEETGSGFSKDIIDEYARKTDFALVYEAASTADCARVIERKGKLEMHLVFHGKAGHAGYALVNDGVNAIHEMALWITELTRLHSAETNTSVNVGVVSGGQAVNIIADRAEMEVEIRYERKEEMERAVQLIDSLYSHAASAGVQVETVRHRTASPMQPVENTALLLEYARDAAEKSGLPLILRKRGGLSDSNHIIACGCAALDGMGPTGNHDHSDKEYLEISTVEPNVRFSTELLCLLAQRKAGREL